MLIGVTDALHVGNEKLNVLALTHVASVQDVDWSAYFAKVGKGSSILWSKYINQQ